MSAVPQRPWADDEPALQHPVVPYHPPRLIGRWQVPDSTATQVLPAYRPDPVSDADTQIMPRYRPELAESHPLAKPAPVFTPDPGPDAPRRPRIIAFMPVYNGADVVAAGIESLLNQTRPLDEIIIVPNGCVDETAEIARRYPVTVFELPKQEHKKAGALNKAWHKYGQDADLAVFTDDDTVLPGFAVEHFEKEMLADPSLGGSSCQPVMTGNDLLSRIQRAEFAESATMSLRRGWCRVISGTGCVYRNEALREASLIPGQEGPWTYRSVVEDYHLTFQLRKMGWLCVMSPTVYCLTGSMKTVRALWAQRMKWQSGTIGDLINFGFNRLNWREWMQQVFGLICPVFWLLWLTLNGAEAAEGHLKPNIFWLIYPLIFMVVESIHAWRIHGRDWKDMLLAASLIKTLGYTWLTMGWTLASWWIILRGSKKDLWNAQYKADGTEKEGAVEDVPDNERHDRPEKQAVGL